MRFTSWMGNNSTTNKQRRLLAELSTNLAASGHVHAGRADVRLLYVPVLKDLITRPLAAQGQAAIDGVLDIMRVGGGAGAWRARAGALRARAGACSRFAA
jgi:replication factor C subunit 1